MKFSISNSKFSNSARGQVILLTVLVLAGSMLGASVIAGYLMLLKIRASSDITNSARAIFAADAGVEWELYKQIKDPGYPKPSLSNGAEFTTYQNEQMIKSIGESSGVFRAFEMNYTLATTTVP